jgi:hypothetical protein
MKKIVEWVVIISIVCFFTKDVYAQIDSTSIRIPQLMALQNNQSLVSQAIDGAVYLVRQEYLLESPSGEHLGRGILNHFGKTYRIGILVDRDLWIPSSTRMPWQGDPHFQEYGSTHKPICSLTKVKKINADTDYRVFEIKEMSPIGALTSFRPGITGLNASDSLPQSGKLLIYYVEADESPDESTIKSTTVNLNQIVWKAEGTAEIKDVQFKDRLILGGALFIEKVSLGNIAIELVAIYADEEENWVLQAVAPLKDQPLPSN